MSDKKVRINITIPLEMHEFYKEKSKQVGGSMSSYMSYILYTHMYSEQEQEKSVIGPSPDGTKSR